MNDTPERRKQVAFVDYLSVGQSLMVKKGNPKKINSLREPRRARASRSRSARRTSDVPRRREQAAEEEGQDGDQGRHVPEGHGRRERAEDRPRRCLLRRLARRRVLHQARLVVRVRRLRRSTRSRSGSRLRKGDALIPKVQKAVDRDVRRRDDEEDPRQVEDVGRRTEEVVSMTSRGAPTMLAAFDWHTFWDRIFGVDTAFAHGALRDDLHRRHRAGARRRSSASSRRSCGCRACACLQVLSGFYVWIFRGTPVIVQIFFVYFGVNILFGVTLIPNSLDLGPLHARRRRVRGHPRARRSTRARTCARSSAPASTRSTAARWRRRARSG